MATGPEFNENKYRNMRLGVQGLASDIGPVVAAAGAATLNDMIGLVTTEDLTSAQNAIYTLTLTNNKIAVGDLVFVTVANGTNTQGTAMVGEVTPAAGSCTIQVINKHASAEAFNGTLKIGYFVVKALSGL